MKAETSQTFARWAMLPAYAAHLAVAAVSLAMFAFAQPLADDFCTAANALEVSDYLRHMYLRWSGRWLSLAIEKVALSSLDPTRVYPYLLVALAACHLGSFYLFVRGFFRDALPPRLIVTLSGSLFVLYWSLHPSLGQAYYWFTGAVEYQLALSTALALLAILMNAPSGEGRRLARLLCGASAATLGFLAPGMHELFGLMLCVVLVAGWVVSRSTGHRNSKLWAVAAACAVAGFVFVVATPGYSVRRADFFPDSYNVPLALWLTSWQAIKACTIWICDAKLLSATVLFVLHPRLRAIQPDWLLRAPVFWKRLALGGWVALLAIGFGAPALVTGQEMPRRVLGGVYLVFLLGWFLAVFVFTRHIANEPALQNLSPRVLSWTLLLFALSIATTGTARTAIYDLVHSANPWRQALQQRFDLIRTAASQGSSDIVVPEAPPRPATFFQGPADITSQASDWKNECQANFFGVSSLRFDQAE